jgi:dihydrofolate reductase
MKEPAVSFVVAMSSTTRAIGKDNDLLWKIPEDLKHFRKVTIGRPMIMGRKTFDSIGHPLPKRENIVVTRNKAWSHFGVTVCHSLEDALHFAKTKNQEEVTIIGGSHIFREALPFVTRMYLTLVDDPAEGDVYMPDFNMDDFIETSRVENTFENVPYTILTLDKKIT